MISVVGVDSVAPHYLKQLRQIFHAEWQAARSPALEPQVEECPLPLVAIVEEELVGGLSFVRYPAPGGPQNALWINAVLVLPEQRRKRIASRLIAEAEVSARAHEEQRLFVYTDIPELYEQLDWKLIDIDGTHVILHKIL